MKTKGANIDILKQFAALEKKASKQVLSAKAAIDKKIAKEVASVHKKYAKELKQIDSMLRSFSQIAEIDQGRQGLTCW